MRFLFAICKLILTVTIILSFMVIAFGVILLTREGSRRRRINSRLVSFYCKLCLWGLNARVKVKNRPTKRHHALYVSNHVGFVDIFILASIQPCLFITSQELKETPGVGTLTEMGGCLYVERRSRANIQNEVKWIRQALVEGFSVVLFPEARSTDGQMVHPFKRTLLTATAGTNVPIQPAVINYRKVNGQKMSPRFRDNLFWYDDTSFPVMTWRMLQLWSFEVEIEFLNPVHCHSEEQRHEIASTLHDMISAKYDQIPLH